MRKIATTINFTLWWNLRFHKLYKEKICCRFVLVFFTFSERDQSLFTLLIQLYFAFSLYPNINAVMWIAIYFHHFLWDTNNGSTSFPSTTFYIRIIVRYIIYDEWLRMNMWFLFARKNTNKKFVKDQHFATQLFDTFQSHEWYSCCKSQFHIHFHSFKYI